MGCAKGLVKMMNSLNQSKHVGEAFDNLRAILASSKGSRDDDDGGLLEMIKPENHFPAELIEKSISYIARLEEQIKTSSSQGR